MHDEGTQALLDLQGADDIENAVPVTHWASDAPGAESTWLEYVIPAMGEYTEPRRFRVNVSYLLSNHKCIFGQGCPGVLVHGAMLDTGCCQIGVHIANKSELRRLQAAVGELTKDDCDAWEEIQEAKLRGDEGEGWFYKVPKKDQQGPGEKYHTVVKNGACILANRSGGPAGGIGCALHRMALRTGKSPLDTKPDICWQVPTSVTEEWDEDREEYVVTVTATHGQTWGSKNPSDPEFIGWFCTETPDAFVNTEPVYISVAEELRRMIGEREYSIMKGILDREYDKMQRVASVKPHPGAVTNGGRPLIPLMVATRVQTWRERGKKRDIQAIARSQDAIGLLGLVGKTGEKTEC
jgi:hypothetical protein